MLDHFDKSFSPKAARWGGVFMVAVLLALAVQAQDDAQRTPPAGLNPIRSIVTNGSTLVVTVEVPAGTNQVVLQSQASGVAGSWKPLAVRRVTGAGRQIVFKVTKPKAEESYRALIGPIPLPAKFYKGRSSFPAAKGSAGNLALVGGTLAAPVAAGSASDPSAATTANSVSESDIWNISGDRLYFFNQDRGLQVFDVSTPDAAVLLGTLSLPGAGEQLYVLDSAHVLLLTQDCSDNSQSQLALIDVSGGVPMLMTNLPLPGSIDDSRQVGSAVYVAYTTFTETNGSAQTGTEVSAFDFSNPSAPARGATLGLPGWNNILTASGNFLLAVSSDPTNYLQSDIACIDISAGNGAMALRSTIQTAGQIQDQFSLSLSSNILSVVSEAWNDPGNFGSFYEEIWLENFSLADPGAPVLVGVLDLGPGDFGAARFDSNRAYIASGYGGQPLTIVDLTDPANPVVAGQVNDPTAGQSFIFPLGNQLVTIGPDTNYDVSLSLFDVTDAARPSLLSQVDLGTNYSWSEAESDFQAFTLLPAAGLIMIPYQSYDFNGNSSSGIQLIDLNANSLRLRGVIAQAQARRATFRQNRVLSLSGTDLLSADISDRDHPVITQDLVLSWPVDQVFFAGGYLVELSTGVSEQTQPVVTVASAAAPNIALAQWTLTNTAVLGAALQGSNLYLLQGPVPTGFFLDPLLAASADSDQTNSTTLTLSILDLGGLPALSVLGQTNITVSQAPGAGVQAVWPQSGTLVWVAAARQEWFWPVAGGMAQPLARPAALKTARHKTAVHKATLAAKAPVTTLPLLPWFYDGGGIQLYAFDVSTPARPVLSSTVTVGTNGWPNGNAASATNGLVYVSHSVWSNVGEGFNERNELDVVDFTVPPAPIARSPVNIPGALAGISRSGNVVYSVDFEGTLAALAYDGVSAYLIADLPAPTNSFQAALVEGETVYDARLSSNDGTTSLLEAWTLANSGQFALEGSLTLPQPDYGMADFGNLLGLQVGSGLELVNITNPNQLVSVGSGASSQCLWLSLAGADGALGSGLWLPLGAYGVFSISAP